jgi:hypothetical protein
MVAILRTAPAPASAGTQYGRLRDAKTKSGAVREECDVHPVSMTTRLE